MPTKPCIVCGEQIQDVATRCPHCHQLQSKTLQFFNTGWGAVAVLTVAAAVTIYFAVREPVLWADHSSEVKMSEIQVRATNRAQGTEMACQALLTNRTPYRWKDLVVEATFFGSDGQLIDTATHRLGPIVLGSNGEARVRVLEKAAWDASEYAKCSITIRHATRD